MTAVISPVPTLSTGLSTGLSNIGALGTQRAEAASRLQAGTALADPDIDRSTRGAQVTYDAEIGSFQRLTGVVAQGQNLVSAAGNALINVRTELTAASDLLSAFTSTQRSGDDYLLADVDFQEILSLVEKAATSAQFDDVAILTRTSSASISAQAGISVEGGAGVLNLTARNFDNRTVGQGGDGAFTVTLNATENAGGIDFTATATATASGAVATYRGSIAAADIDSTTAGSEALTNGKTVVLALDTADPALASLTRNRSEIVLSLDVGYNAAAVFAAGALGDDSSFAIDADADGGALLVEGRSAPYVDGAQDFQIQVAGSILEALGLSGASIRDQAKLESASEALAQAFTYLDQSLADVEGAAAVLSNAASAISTAIRALEDGQDRLGTSSLNEAQELVSFISGALGGEYAERATSIAAINSQAVAAVTESSEIRVEVNLLEGLFPLEFVDFLNDESTLGLISQLSIPEKDYIQAVREGVGGGGALARLGVQLPADIIESNPQTLIDSRQAVRDLASSIAAIGRPNVPNYVSRLD